MFSDAFIVPENQQEKIIQKYFDAYQADLASPSLEQLTSIDSYLLASFIYQDLTFVILTFEQAQLYKNAGSQVFAYMIDVTPKSDLLLKKPALFKGLGHAGELNYVFDSPNYFLYEYWMNCTANNWEFDLTDLLFNQWSTFIRDGKPMTNWGTLNESYETYFITESNNQIDTRMKTFLGQPMMKFWLEEWSPSWEPLQTSP